MFVSYVSAPYCETILPGRIHLLMIICVNWFIGVCINEAAIICLSASWGSYLGELYSSWGVICLRHWPYYQPIVW